MLRDHEFDEPLPHDADSEERAPGVYVRTGERQPHELDMLWSGTRNFAKEERAPIISFIIGLLLGVFLTTGAFIFFINKPQITAGENKLTAPINETQDIEGVQEESQTVTPSPQTTSQAKKVSRSAAATTSPTAAVKGVRTYKVKNGDTLGKIAQKEYGSLDPNILDKIQRANNLKNVNDIHIGQELVLPPSSY